MKPQLSWGSSPTPKPGKPQPFCATPSPTPRATAGAQCSRMRPCMLSQHPSLTRTYLAATTSRATPLLSVKSLLKSPTPQLQQTPSPLLRRLAWTWPSPLHIREPLAYSWLASCPMLWLTPETVFGTEHYAVKEAREKKSGSTPSYHVPASSINFIIPTITIWCHGCDPSRFEGGRTTRRGNLRQATSNWCRPCW